MDVVVIDPGHGGQYRINGSSPNNATGPSGQQEKDVTLAIAKAAKASPGTLHVVLTRDTDINLSLKQRAEAAKDQKAPAFVSIHCNGWNDPKVQGTTTYVHERASPDSLRLANAVQRRLLKATGLTDRGVKRAAFGVLDPASHSEETAACLAEVSFITNPQEDQRLADDGYRRSLAAAILSGVTDYLAAAPDLLELGSAADLPLEPGNEDEAEVNLGLDK